MNEITIPSFEGTVTYQDYDEVIRRIKRFSNYSTIGKDESGQFDIYMIELGNEINPTLFITASLHGTEWQGTQYSLDFMEQIRDDLLPDKELRDKLLKEFHIAYIPVVNPYGYSNTTPHAITRGRYNSTGADLNRDFDEFTQKESRFTRDRMLETKPFAYLDCHLIRASDEREELLMVGNGQPETDYVKEKWISALEEYTGYKVESWKGSKGLTRGLSRRFMRDQPNNYTPFTLSYVTEITRPVNENSGFVAPLSDAEIYKAGMANVYLFFKTSIDYFEEYKQPVNSYINTPNKDIEIFRDLNGVTQSLRETYTNGLTISTSFDRDNDGIVQSIKREKV